VVVAILYIHNTFKNNLLEKGWAKKQPFRKRLSQNYNRWGESWAKNYNRWGKGSSEAGSSEAGSSEAGSSEAGSSEAGSSEAG
jgi:hypothetical protein